MQGGSGGNSPIFFVLKRLQAGKNLSVPKNIIINLKNNNFKDNTSSIVKIIRHTFHQYQGRVAC